MPGKHEACLGKHLGQARAISLKHEREMCCFHRLKWRTRSNVELTRKGSKMFCIFKINNCVLTVFIFRNILGNVTKYNIKINSRQAPFNIDIRRKWVLEQSCRRPSPSVGLPVSLSIGWSVSLSVRWVNYGKTIDCIWMLFGVMSGVSQGIGILDGGGNRRREGHF